MESCGATYQLSHLVTSEMLTFASTEPSETGQKYLQLNWGIRSGPYRVELQHSFASRRQLAQGQTSPGEHGAGSETGSRGDRCFRGARVAGRENVQRLELAERWLGLEARRFVGAREQPRCKLACCCGLQPNTEMVCV